MPKYLDENGLLYFWQKIKLLFASKAESKAEGVKSITRSGTTFTVTRPDDTTFTFTQQDTNTWNANAVNTAGYVAAPTSSNANKVWKTNANGEPAWRDDANTTYSAATTSAAGLMSASDKTKLDGIATGANAYTHPSYTARTGKPTANATPGFGDTFTVSQITSDGTGHVTAATDRTVKIPSTAATTSAAGLMSATDKTKLDGIAEGANAYTHPSYTARTGKPAANATPGFGGTFTVSQITSDATGHVTAATDRTITIPSTAATTSAAGLMSAADKTKLNKLVFDSNNLIDSSILPSYVDDVIEAYPRTNQTALSSAWLATGSASGTVITPEAGKIYVLMADSGDYGANTQFRWGGTAYVKLNDGGVTAITNAEIDAILAA